MKNESKTPRRLAGALFAGALLAGLHGPAAFAQSGGYLTNNAGAVKSGSGQCWRTGEWTPALATEECDPELMPKVAAPAPAPAPTPPVAVAPAPRPAPVMAKVTLSADTLFDFDKATLRPDGKAKLDELVGNLKSVDLETVIAVGYTDRIGSAAYNQKLSLRRAQAVEAYLADRGVPANRIHIEGKGKDNPVTRPGQCTGRRSPKLIACLQPDRRVELEVIGNRSR